MSMLTEAAARLFANAIAPHLSGAQESFTMAVHVIADSSQKSGVRREIHFSDGAAGPDTPPAHIFIYEDKGWGISPPPAPRPGAVAV